jgi:LysR family transcriptional regulator, chromosome initiation inhibitor
MRVDSAQLHAFVTVVREGSFEAASRALNISASAVSQRIRQLEDRLGQVLIHRSVPCKPTIAGKTLARYAEQISVLEAETLRALANVTLFSPNQLRIPFAINADSLESWFMATFEEIPLEYAVYLDLRIEHEDHSASHLRDGSVLAAVTADRMPVQGCRVISLGSMSYVAVASRDFASQYFRDGVHDRGLASAPMITFNAKDELQYRFIRKFCSRPLSPPTHFIPSSTGFVEASRRGIGWCMVPALMARQHLKTGELVEISPGTTLDVPLYLQHWSIRSQVLETLARAVKDVARRLLKQEVEVAPSIINSQVLNGLDASPTLYQD